ncbi:MAG TPA: hypothetical protein VNG53_07680 [Bacteroidia bacterium]|nr:hypothetical protein [Bacteroidia bacterium]
MDFLFSKQFFLYFYTVETKTRNIFFERIFVFGNESFFSEYATGFRFGFNKGSEKDNEIYGTGNAYTTFNRELDDRLVRWWTEDPKMIDFPDWSPYSFSFDNPISLNDPMGDVGPGGTAHRRHKVRSLKSFTGSRIKGLTRGKYTKHIGMSGKKSPINQGKKPIKPAQIKPPHYDKLPVELEFKDVGKIKDDNSGVTHYENVVYKGTNIKYSGTVIVTVKYASTTNDKSATHYVGTTEAGEKNETPKAGGYSTTVFTVNKGQEVFSYHSDNTKESTVSVQGYEKVKVK